MGRTAGQNEIVGKLEPALTFSEPEVETVKCLTEEEGCDYALMQLRFQNSGAARANAAELSRLERGSASSLNPIRRLRGNMCGNGLIS